MSINKAVGFGLAGNELSKRVTGTSRVCVGRTAVATGLGAAFGGAITVAGATAAGIAAAPIVIPLSVASASVAFIASLFD